MYRKVYGLRHARDAKLANAAVLALSAMADDAGLPEIIARCAPRLATTRPSSNIERVFARLAEARGVSVEALSERAVPSLGLDSEGCRRDAIGDFTATIILRGAGGSDLVWIRNRDGKVQKSVPAEVRRSEATALKSLRLERKEIDAATAAHAIRIERQYLSSTSHDVTEWRQRYIDHPLTGFLGRRLIWRIRDGSETRDVLHTDDGFITSDGAPTAVPGAGRVALWHPSEATVDEVLAWRRQLLERGLTQTFKQAHREVYLVTDAERSAGMRSARFADHLLDHARFHALAGQRGWSQMRGGEWDGGRENAAYLNMPGRGLSVEFEAEGAESGGCTDSGIFEMVGTGAVIFTRANTHRHVALANVDPLVFSEVMRDIDLFVSVASVANDPNWREREPDYWNAQSSDDLSAIAGTRRDVLEVLAPKLGIAERLTIENRFLTVRGNLGSYRIHLGSAHVFTVPEDRYVCIVPTRRRGAIVLPFEGDPTLSLILSKAFMLAADDRVKDPVVLAQIHRPKAA